MDDIPAHALLREALTLLNDHPNFSLRHWRRQSSYRLARRIETYLARRELPSADAIGRLKSTFGPPRWLRFDLPTPLEAENWLPAWVFAPGNPSNSDRLAALDDAIAALLPLTREVFLAHRDRSLDYGAIARELGISVGEVERHIAVALVRLDEAVTAAERRA